MAEFPFIFVFLIWTHYRVTDSLQCYTCKASGVNEVDANIRCLENAYLEKCDEFYNYYNDVEEELYDYYYNFEDDLGDPDDTRLEDVNQATGGATEQDVTIVPAYGQEPEQGGTLLPGGRPGPGNVRHKRRAKNSRKSSEEDEEYDYVSRERRVSNEGEEEYEYEYESEEKTESESKEKKKGKGKNKSRRNRTKDKKRKNRKSSEEEEEYEYEYYDDEELLTTPMATTPLPTTPKPPAKPEHYCYSVTEKSGWEGYSVEKGCKKIVYCKDALANKPAWAHPWNFCCDRSRCNVKLVKDKPQRVFGMGCRRTDDCIQGHNTRPVCPHFFKSCPRISTSLVQMECRVQARTMASVKGAAKYKQTREKRCFCSKGYFPKGPICTNSAASSRQFHTVAYVLATVAVRVSALILVH